MAVVQNQSGTLSEEYWDENCAVKILNLLQDEVVVYFHNLSYDITNIIK